MTHDELLAKINYDIEGNPYDEYTSAIRAVVELHKPDLEGAYPVCTTCQEIYPCGTIQAIEKELNG
jgi:hypothetical protein